MLKSSLLDESISISVLNIYTNMGLSGTPNNGKENISYELGDLYLLAHSIRWCGPRNDILCAIF